MADDEGTLDSIGRLGFFEKGLEPARRAYEKYGLQLAGHDLRIGGTKSTETEFTKIVDSWRIYHRFGPCSGSESTG